jgi:hypothetical protein
MHERLAMYPPQAFPCHKARFVIAGPQALAFPTSCYPSGFAEKRQELGCKRFVATLR